MEINTVSSAVCEIHLYYFFSPFSFTFCASRQSLTQQLKKTETNRKTHWTIYALHFGIALQIQKTLVNIETVRM